jgi:hypothetical protein
MNEEKFTVGEEFRFQGRTFEEYRHLFDLDGVPGTVLDCPGGPSSFAAVAGSAGATAYAVDSMYGQSVDELEEICQRAIERTTDQLREKRDVFVWDYYGDVEMRCRYLRAAAERFLADYSWHPGRYVEAALPDLPFVSDAVDLVCSANFLFLYDDRLDLSFHRESLAELSRVARDEVRVFPLASLDADRSAHVQPAVESLREAGHFVEFREVPYEFQPGVTEMLVVSTTDG